MSCPISWCGSRFATSYFSQFSVLVCGLCWIRWLGAFVFHVIYSAAFPATQACIDSLFSFAGFKFVFQIIDAQVFNGAMLPAILSCVALPAKRSSAQSWKLDSFDADRNVYVRSLCLLDCALHGQEYPPLADVLFPIVRAGWSTTMNLRVSCAC